MKIADASDPGPIPEKNPARKKREPISPFARAKKREAAEAEKLFEPLAYVDGMSIAAAKVSRNLFRKLARLAVYSTEGRQRALVLTKLQEASFHFNRGLAEAAGVRLHEAQLTAEKEGRR